MMEFLPPSVMKTKNALDKSQWERCLQSGEIGYIYRVIADDKLAAARQKDMTLSKAYTPSCMNSIPARS